MIANQAGQKLPEPIKKYKSRITSLLDREKFLGKLRILLVPFIFKEEDRLQEEGSIVQIAESIFLNKLHISKEVTLEKIMQKIRKAPLPERFCHVCSQSLVFK